MPNARDYSATDPRYASVVASMVRAISTGASQLLINALCDAFAGQQPINSFVTRASFENLPNILCSRFEFAGDVLICFGGTRSAPGAMRLINGWTEPLAADLYNFYWNREVQAQADYWWSSVNTPTPGKIYHVAGHSVGGGVAYAIAQNLLQRDPTAFVYVSTFGAPKVAARDTNAALSNASISRWVNSDDEVPTYPPTPANAPLIHANIGPAASRNTLRWVHPSRNNVLNTSGYIQLNTADTVGAPITSATLANAASGAAGALGEAHTMDAYVDRLLAAVRLLPVSAPSSPPPVQPPVPTAPTPPPTPAVQQVMRAASQAFRDATSNNEMLAPQIPKVSRFTWYKSGSLWYLNFYGSEVAIHTSKRKMRALADHGNKFLKYFQSVGQADTPLFVAALASYLTAAAAGGGGFVPPLNDGGNPPGDPFLS